MLTLDDHEQFIKLKTRKGQVPIGSEPRKYDPIYYGAQNKELFTKGLM